ncbi:MAG TPA: porin family protein, partial [Bacteroidia bacterium]|nr:porin family protein [Bacteroidia bacterium]
MKKTKILRAALALSSGLLLSGVLHAQHDTVRAVHETTTTQHDVVRTTDVNAPAAPPAARTTQDPATDNTLHHGEFGVRFLPTFTSLAFNTENKDVVRGEVTMTYGYGVMLGLNFTKHVGIEIDGNYSAISQKYKDQNMDREVHISYIDVPVLLSLNTDKSKWVNLNVVVGPQFGINVGSSINTTNGSNQDSVHAVLAVKQGDVGIAYGAGLEFALTPSHALRFDVG